MSASPTTPPSGVQHEICFESRRAVITEVGATLRSYRVDGLDVIDGFPIDRSSTAGRGQVLAPWPNRLEEGTYEFEGRAGSAALDEPSRSNAIHGLVRWMPWRLISRTDDSTALGCIVHPQPAYPWGLELRIEHRLSPAGLTITTAATNRSDVTAPFGIGFHPYLTVGTTLIDDAHLTLPARRRLRTDERGLPTGDEAVRGTDLDFTTPRAIESTRMDTAFTDLHAASEGTATVRLERSDGSRQGIAIEPMTCPPNALRTGTDLIRLDPGSSWTARWGIRA
jgi:aldose 1-epimerase